VTRKTALLATGTACIALALWLAAAPATACPHQGDATAPSAVQEEAMRCLVDHARLQSGLAGFAAAPGLNRAADRKSGDVLRCDEFSHEACGREFAYWIRRFGHFGAGCSGVAENIAWGTGALATPRAIFRAWMRSPGHRRNILGPYALLGIGLRVGTFEDRAATHVWTQEFAGHGC
jgi:uncharacterized protein YkwD